MSSLKRKSRGDGDAEHDAHAYHGGTANVARGLSGAESVERRRSLLVGRLSEMTPRERERVNAHLRGPNDHLDRKRRADLRRDDADMRTDHLSPQARRALERRRGGGTDRVLKAKMDRADAKRVEAAAAAADAEVVLSTDVGGMMEAEGEMERTYMMSQAELRRDHLDEQTARQIYDLKLNQYGPYGMRYDRSGRWGLLRGRRGHVAVMDCHALALRTEFHVNETVRDGTFLHNHTLFALAQRDVVFVYDDSGTEIHRMADHRDVFRLQFLPYHWLLATVGRAGFLRYHDTSTGDLVSAHRTKLGACSVMAQNPSNAVVHLGHNNGTVTLWSPASSTYLAKILCHKAAPISCMAVDRTGRYMVTGAADCHVRVWDLRNYRESHSYLTHRGGPPTSIDISQRGILGVGRGFRATFWGPEALREKVSHPYMNHTIPGCGPMETLAFRPYEDVCGIGHRGGFSSIVIPGSGEPNLDSMEYNVDPYQDKKQRREAEVRALLDKLSPDMIALDPGVVGTIEESDPRRRLERQRDLEEEANARKEEEEGAAPKKEKKRMRGRSKIQKKLGRKQKNVVDAQVLKLREAREKEKAEKAKAKASKGDDDRDVTAKDEAPQALKRFFK